MSRKFREEDIDFREILPANYEEQVPLLSGLITNLKDAIFGVSIAFVSYITVRIIIIGNTDSMASKFFWTLFSLLPGFFSALTLGGLSLLDRIKIKLNKKTKDDVQDLSYGNVYDRHLIIEEDEYDDEYDEDYDEDYDEYDDYDY